MSIDLVAFKIILLFINPFAVELSVWMGVRGCRCPSSSRVFRIGTAVLAFKNRAPSLAWAADDMTFLTIVDMLRTAPLLGVGFGVA